MKKCPPGVICFENITLVIIFICVSIVVYFVYSSISSQQNFIPNQQVIINERRGRGAMLNYPYTNIPYSDAPNDVLLNPYSPPLKDERYVVSNPNYIIPGTVPINVPTNAIETTYRQVGILTPLNGREKDNILPLMGRMLFVRRDLWNYYTISNQHNNVKLPISVKGRSALNENGVDRVYNGDTVYVEGANQPYKVTIYDNDTIRYLPNYL
jgi:hypothetical protein